MKFSNALRASACAAALILTSQAAFATSVQVTITNNAPTGGVYLTPVWVGFHDGSFDSYDGGTASAPALEALVEDGNTGPISDVFAGTLVGDAVDGRVQGTLGGGPVAPGQTVTQTFELSADGSNQYFSYASMVLPSNDYYVANGNPFAHSLASIFNGMVNEIVFNIGTPGTVNDAGTEVNDFATSAGNGLFGLPGGQTGPNQGADEGGVNANVVGDPFAGFLNTPAGLDLSLFNFNDSSLYANGIATVRISLVNPVPVPAALPLFAAGLSMLGFMRRKRA
ncbi:MAG: spondin domain-containing protein [Gammaproteobacteria bacterium]